MKSLDFWVDEYQIKVILALIVMIITPILTERVFNMYAIICLSWSPEKAEGKLWALNCQLSTLSSVYSGWALALGWEDILHVGGPWLRDEAEGWGVEAADHQPLGLKGQMGVLCEALLVHATQEAVHVHGGGGLSKLVIGYVYNVYEVLG